jgi:RES domain
MSSLELPPQESYVLPMGTGLYRVHRVYRQAISFNSSQAFANERDGRFDSDADGYYPFYYAALSERGALYETLVAEASLAVGDPIPRSALFNRVLSAVELTRDVTLISLRSEADLALVGQSEWLVRAKPHEYPLTRHQVRSLRSKFPWAEGLIWYSRKDPDGQSLVLFGDRCNIDTIQKADLPSVSLDIPGAEAWLAKLLAPHSLAKA